MQEYRPDATDLRLVHALQIEPRASWTDLARVLRTDPVTLSRRWARLKDAGLAWITGYAGGDEAGSGALIEVDCHPGDTLATANALAQEPEIISIDLTAGGRDIVLTMVTDSVRAVSDYVLSRLQRFPAIRSIRTHLVIDMIAEGGAWRLRALTPGEIERIPRPHPPRPRAAQHVPEALRQTITRALARDGRASAASIAAEANVSTQRVADAISTLRANGRLLLRTDIARAYSGWPVYAWYFMRAPASSIELLRRPLAHIEEVRLAALSASEYSLIMGVWLRNLSEVHRFELHLEKMLPGVEIADRSIVIRIAKHLGHIVDADGRVTEVTVPWTRP